MSSFLIVLIVAVAAVLLLFAALGIKMLLHRGQFKRPCTNRDPYNPQTTNCQCQQLHPNCTENQRYPYTPLQVPDMEDKDNKSEY